MNLAHGIDDFAEIALGGDFFGGQALIEEPVIENHRCFAAFFAGAGEHGSAFLEILLGDVGLASACHQRLFKKHAAHTQID